MEPAPSIAGEPALSATPGIRYLAQFDATYSCFIFVCDALTIVQGPPGAGVAHDSVFWTPSADQANRNYTFVVSTSPDTCGNTVSRSWAVSVGAVPPPPAPPPVIASFAAGRTTVLPGEQVTLTAVFQAGNGFIDDIGPVTSGVPITTPNITTDKFFRLTVVNADGESVTTGVNVHVIAPPNISSFSTTPSTIGTGSTAILRWTLGGDYSRVQVDPGGVDVTGVSSLVVGPSATTTYVLTVTGNTIVTSTVQVTVVPPAAIRKFAATPASTTPLGSVSLAVDFDGTNGRIEEEVNGVYNLLASVTSGDAVDSGPLYHTKRFRLTVENALGQSTTRDLVVPLVGPGTFQPTAGQPRLPGRSYHGAIRLADGRVFIAGSNLGGVTLETEIFDPVTDSFSDGPNLLDTRAHPSLALLADGRVLVLGGQCAAFFGTCPTSEIVDPTRGTVIAGPRMGPVLNGFGPPIGPAVTLLDGRVLVSSFDSAMSGIVIFDPSTGTISPLIPSPFGSPQSLHLMADGRVLLGRGFNAPGEIFTPGLDVISEGGPITARSTYVGTLLQDGRLLITGGLTVASAPAEAYDPVTNSSSTSGTQQIAAGFGAFPDQTSTRLTNGDVLIVVGNNTPFAELFDPATGTFSVTGGLRTARNIHSGMITTHTATLLADGRVLVVGGCATLPCEAEIYSP